MADLSTFDPNSVGLKSNNIFGLPFKEDESELVLLPVPWEVTVSYRQGTARGPENVFDASMQVDLYDPDVVDGWKKGFYMLPVDKNIRKKSDYLRQCAELIISCLIDGGEVCKNEQLSDKLEEVNNGGKMLTNWVYEMTHNLLKEGKKVGLIGGDHSTPLGFVKALAGVHESFGILQIDAHADLREAYEGFTYSHASIMYNVLKEVPGVEKLVQVGIRDYCDEELELAQQSNGRVQTFFDKDIKARQYEGDTWKQICNDIINALPQKVYISFDIDGLDPKLCPNTGTPVPGGFEVEQIFYLFKQLHASGRELIGFDLNEVSCGEHSADGIDAIVGARVLYKLCNYMVAGK
ncbi:agmatinase family protein [Taibaiella soli]|uniref:Agmatinase n=1 Tax=Taibaiella soli TaxID=1649169 RepID=A0A2W2BG15_9BACT|nr:agmatinase family protein [Taibaiella soli]PZF72426.1 agmatinase [Taibaiella soli]